MHYFSPHSAVAALLCLLPIFAVAADKQLLWGDTHLHTSYSADSYLMGNFSIDPDSAFRFARGEEVLHPQRQQTLQIEVPLDFLVVADHAEFLGGIRQIHTRGIDTETLGPLDTLLAWLAEVFFRVILADGYAMDLFDSFSSTPSDPVENAAQLLEQGSPSLPGQQQIIADNWRASTLAADANNRPGEFTALIGWEWTSAPGGANLHRVIITDGDAESAAHYIPFSRDDSPYPEDLWHWLERTSAASGAGFVAIPHNSNLSKGYMFPGQTLRGQPFTEAYLQLRRKWEPVVEATQIKGDSETHPALSPQDAFAAFERYTHYIQAYATPYSPEAGDFVRSALLRGLSIGTATGINPYQFGLIGSSDAHGGLSDVTESRFSGGMDSADDSDAVPNWDLSAAGLAAVWASENTREEILRALQRREVYATTGPRIIVQFQAGWSAPDARLRPGNMQPDQVQDPDVTATPMGGELPTPPSARALPTFTLSAMKAANGANLDRIQVVKGWVDARGDTHERVFDVAWSGPRQRDAQGTLPVVGNSVDEGSARYSNSIGAPALQATWQDWSFEPGEPAFYYARVLEIPTPRHSLYATVAGAPIPPPRIHSSIQERAYTSPIWYRP